MGKYCGNCRYNVNYHELNTLDASITKSLPTNSTLNGGFFYVLFFNDNVISRKKQCHSDYWVQNFATQDKTSKNKNRYVIFSLYQVYYIFRLDS